MALFLETGFHQILGSSPIHPRRLIFFLILSVGVSRMLLLFVTILFYGCRIVPIQMVRVTQTESFKQTFDGLRMEQAERDVLTRPANWDQNRKIDEVFNALLGTYNFQKIKDRYGLSAVRDELLAGSIVSEGMLNFTLYINPHDHSQFLIEGTGRYFIVRSSTGEIMLSGDFKIPLQIHQLDALQKGQVPVNISLYASDIGGNSAHFHMAQLIYNVSVSKIEANKKTYAIKRNGFRHGVYLLKGFGEETIDNAIHIGNMQFEDDDSQSKIIDLRGLKMVRKDYN